MFQVSRYDPRDEDRKAHEGSKSKGRKRKGRDSPRKKLRNDGDQSVDEGRPLSVIAPEPESTGTHVKLSTRMAEEAFDDLDLVEELIDGDIGSQTDELTEDDDTKQRTGQLSQEEIQTALDMCSVPIEEAVRAWDLASFLLDNLKRDGFARFFPIQALAIPDVITSERRAHIRAQDICITAPTGSGKTLSYVLPILNSLSRRQFRRLRALVVLPSRDLATQVYHVFQSYVEGSDLRVGLAIGQSDFQAEQIALTVDPEADIVEAARHRLSFEPGNLELALKAFSDPSSLEESQSFPRDGRSNVDVLVCTPGRLLQHLSETPGFTLQHLRFLVVDEADRLLNQSYHNWIGRVIESANSASTAAHRDIIANDNKLPPLRMAPDRSSFILEPITWRRGGTAGDASEFSTNDSFFEAASSVCRPVQLRKFLVSATLTRDPQKLAALRLVNPKHFDIHQLTGKTSKSRKKYSMPEGLDEYTVECTAEQKPIVLLAVLLEQLRRPRPEEHDKCMILIFTASLDSTHRLARLLQLLWVAAGYGEASTVSEFSSSLSQKERSILMERCNDVKDNVRILVCSDGMSRGMDLQYVSTVINYDVPRFAKSYVHRCGRTARAGKRGVAISLLKGGQVRQFTKMRQIIQDSAVVQSMGVKKSLVKDVIPKYRHCISSLREVLDAEENGELRHIDEIPEEYIPDR